jgi:hypothetical protein
MTAERGPRQASQDVRSGCSAGGSPSESSTARDSNGFHECSCLRSVAEVSEGASSSRPRWRGREAESSGRGVARASRIPVTGMASLDRAKGCGAKRASRTANAQSSARSQGRASCPPKASWVHRAVASNRVAVFEGPWLDGSTVQPDERQVVRGERAEESARKRSASDRGRQTSCGRIRLSQSKDAEGHEPPRAEEADRPHQLLACSIRHHGGSCRGEKPRHRRTGTAARTARPASLRNRHGPTMPRGRLATAARRVRTTHPKRRVSRKGRQFTGELAVPCTRNPL